MATINISRGLIGAEDFYTGSNATFSRTKSDGTSQTLNKAVLGTWVYNVKTYGGAEGDGTTDDSTAVLDTINAAIAAGAPVYFPAGTYYVPTLLNVSITSELTIIGAGRDVVTIDGNDSTPVATDKVFTCSAGFTCRGVKWLDIPTIAHFSASEATIDHIDIQDCEFSNVGSPCYWNNPVSASSVLTRLAFRDNIVTTANRGCHVRPWQIDKAWVTGNEFTGCVSRAITVGWDSKTNETLQGRYVVSGNYINGVTEDTADGTGRGANGIELFGFYVSVTDNYIEDVTSTDGNDSEGIYVKCRFCEVTGNNLVDAGQKEGMINVKGDNRAAQAPTKPDGYQSIVAHNTLRRVSNSNARGIFITLDDVVCSQNQFDGFTLAAIQTQRSRRQDNVDICGNVFRNHSGVAYITIEHYGIGLQIRENSLMSSTATSGTVAALNVGTTDGQTLEDVVIADNVIYDLTATSGSGRAIAITCDTGQTIKGVIIDRNVIDTVDKAVTWSGTAAITDMQVSHNVFRNITDAQGAVQGTASSVVDPTTLKIFDNVGFTIDNDNAAYATGFIR